MRLTILFLFFSLLVACDSPAQIKTVSADKPVTVLPSVPDYKYDPPAQEGIVEPFDTTEEYWRETLTDDEYYVLREEGTERSFSSPLNQENREGIFTCAACGLPLFASGAKFKSGTGWPSFFEPINEAYIRQDIDRKLGVKRVEISCARCNGHQGHVFPDGPEPTGLRYCINGVSLNFVPAADFE